MTSDTIDAVHVKLADLLKGFKDEGITIPKLKNVACYSDAEFDFDSSAKSQKIANNYLKNIRKIN